MPFNNKRNSRDDNSKKSRSNSENFNPRGGSGRQQSSSSSDRKPFGKSSGGGSRFDKSEGKSFGRGDREDNRGGDRPFKKFDTSDRKPFNRGGRDENSRGGDRPFKKFDNSDRKPFNRGERDENSRGGDRPFKKFDASDRKPFNRGGRDENSRGGDRPFKKFDNSDRKPFNRGERDENSRGGDRPFKKFDNSDRKPFNRGERNTRFNKFDDENQQEEGRRFGNRRKVATAEPKDDGLIRLNRYISNSGICSRRKADELIESGVVTVNGVAVTELGTKVDPAKDEIKYNGERLKREKMVYVLLNKPKDYITTTDDPQERRTVMHLVAKATKERIYPVGRLDRNTTGLLLLTNDGNLAEKLSHPRNNISKLYNVELNKNLTQGDFNKIQFGIELEDGLIKPDDLSYVQGGSKREVGIQIHSGKNRVVRRIFESLGYEVVKLDRVVYASLTKKDLPRGRWRYLDERELVQIKGLIK